MNKEILIEFSGPNFNEKNCTRCSCIKKRADFYRPCGTNPQKEYSTCNKCYEKQVQEIIFKRFQDAEDLNEPVILAFEIELDSRLVECIFPEFQPYVYDLENIKKNFRQLINIFILLIEDGSGYYLEVWDIYIHLNTRKNIFTGCATVYLGCTQQEDRRWHRPENLPVKRRSEARRYACMGNIILTIDPQQQRILVIVIKIVYIVRSTKFYDNAILSIIQEF
ncbi:hypothetical protein RIR_jg23039.t1 [Rhizophagus irregularis DAOM 181602=DAOM 197198]|nr:hypothetical protein RIR_jg23039.t1 [Rhizophagus irregularis DAOM 181602=DAOM 197198]